MQGLEITRACDVFLRPCSAPDYDSVMASERTTHATASDSTLTAAWNELDRPSDTRALLRSADHAAAEAFLLAAAQQQGSERHDSLRRGGEQLLLNGQIDRALSVMRALSNEIDLTVPERSPALHLQLALSQLQLKLRGWKRAQRSRPPAQLQTLRTLAIGLADAAPVQALTAALRYVHLALDAGDSLHLVRALGLSAALSGSADLDARWAEQALSRMDNVAAEDGSAQAQGFASLIHAWVSQQQEQFAAARKHASAALAQLRECADVEWEIEQASLLDQISACALGDFATSQHTTTVLLEGALQRGRVFSAAKLAGLCGAAAWLAADDVEGYRRVLAEVRQRLPRASRADAAAHWLLLGEAAVSIYTSEPAAGFGLLERASHTQPAFVHNQRKLQLAQHSLLKAQAAASALRVSASSGRLREPIEQAVRLLERYNAPARVSAAECLRAALALEAGLWLPATHRLAAALQLQAAAGLEMSAAATRRRLGQLTGGVAGRQLVVNAEARMRAQGVKNLEAMTELLCPGVRG